MLVDVGSFSMLSSFDNMSKESIRASDTHAEGGHVNYNSWSPLNEQV